MGYQIGRLFQIGIGKEGTRGTAVAATVWIKDASLSIDDKPKFAKDQTSVGRIEDGIGMEVSQIMSEATIEANISDITFGHILMALMGADTPELVDGESTVYDHVFTLLQSAQHPTYSLSVYGINEGAEGAGLVYPLGAMDTLELDFELDKYTNFKAMYKANGNQAQSNTPAVVAENLFKPLSATIAYGPTIAGVIASPVHSVGSGLSDISSGGVYSAMVNNSYIIKISAEGTPDHFEVAKNSGSFGSPIAITGAAQSIGFDGVMITFAATTGHDSGDEWTIAATYGLTSPTAVSVTKIQLSFKKNTQDNEVLGSMNPVDRFNQQFSCSGTFELYYNSRYWIDTALLTGLAQALQFKLVNSGVTIGSGSNPTVTINLAKTILESVARKIDNNKVVTQTIKFTAFYSIANGEMLDITLRNLQEASY